MDIKQLSQKDVEKIAAAAKVVGKFAKYIESVNSLNVLLERNLAESIKAGDVTDEQRMAISYHKSAKGEYERVYAAIANKFPCPDGCDCAESDHENCPAYNMRVVASMMGGMVRGAPWDWDSILEWAAMGRWEWSKRHGYRTAPDDQQKAFGQIRERAKVHETSGQD